MGKELAALAAALLVCCPWRVGAGGDDAGDVKASLVNFLRGVAVGDEQVVRDLRWDAPADPCGVHCTGDGRIRQIVIENRRLNDTIDATLLCEATALECLSLKDNALRGGLPADISNCSNLNIFYVNGNRFSGILPPSLVQLNSLVVLDVSRNDFSGELPGGLSNLSLLRFWANDNNFNGAMPDFNLTKFQNLSVSNNSHTGPIPKNTGSFLPNAGLCGVPLFKPCPPSPSPSPRTLLDTSPTRSKGGECKPRRSQRIVMCLGYVLLGAGIAAFVLYKFCSKKRSSKCWIG